MSVLTTQSDIYHLGDLSFYRIHGCSSGLGFVGQVPMWKGALMSILFINTFKCKGSNTNWGKIFLRTLPKKAVGAARRPPNALPRPCFDPRTPDMPSESLGIRLRRPILEPESFAYSWRLSMLCFCFRRLSKDTAQPLL